MAEKIKKTRSSYRHGNLREAVLLASLRMIDRSGVENLSIRDVAKAAGVSHQAPYRHFKDRDALLAALAKDGFEKMLVELTDAVAQEKTPLRRIIALGEAYLKWAAKNSGHFRLMFSQNMPEFENFEELKKVTEQVLGLLFQVTLDYQNAKLVRKMETRAIARQLWSAVHGASLLFINHQFKPMQADLRSAEALVAEMFTNLLAGLTTT